MEIITKVRDFTEKIKQYSIPSDAYIRVIIGRDDSGLPEIITHEEQKRRLDLMPAGYEPGASEELIKIIQESHRNTDTPEL